MSFIFLPGQGLITGVNGIQVTKHNIHTSMYIELKIVVFQIFFRDAGVAVTKLMQKNSWKKVLFVYR